MCNAEVEMVEIKIRLSRYELNEIKKARSEYMKSDYVAHWANTLSSLAERVNFGAPKSDLEVRASEFETDLKELKARFEEFKKSVKGS